MTNGLVQNITVKKCTSLMGLITHHIKGGEFTGHRYVNRYVNRYVIEFSHIHVVTTYEILWFGHVSRSSSVSQTGLATSQGLLVYHRLV